MGPSDELADAEVSPALLASLHSFVTLRGGNVVWAKPATPFRRATFRAEFVNGTNFAAIEGDVPEPATAAAEWAVFDRSIADAKGKAAESDEWAADTGLGNDVKAPGEA